MNLILTNLLSYAVPFSDGTTAGQLAPNAPMTISDTSEVLIIGDKPGFIDQLKEAAATLAEFIAFWKEKAAEVEEDLRVTIQNNGTKSVRIMLGNGLEYTDIDPGETYSAISPDYIELRELGDVEQGHSSTLEAS